MARRPREMAPGGIYHVWARAVRRQALFETDDDRATYLFEWGLEVTERGWRSLAYCLMGNHVHHVVEVPELDLSDGVRHAHRAYARYFNEAHGHVGHVFQGRFGSTLAKDEEGARYLTCYAILNPVRAGLCVRPQDYPWSSHGHVLGRRGAPNWLDAQRLLDLFGGAGGYRRTIDLVRKLGTPGLAFRA